MKLPSWRSLRPALLMVGAVLTSTGALPQDAAKVIVDNADLVVSGVLGLWSATAFLRNHKDRKASQA